MEKKPNPTPPRWAERFLEWYCKKELLEDLQGDLREYFDRHVKSKGLTRARLIYVFDVIKFIRLYTIRKPDFINALIHWIMISNYVKTSGRNMVRNKLFSFINIAGLAISMSVGLLMISFLADIFSYDKFNANYDRTYRIIATYESPEEPARDFASTSVKTSKLIAEHVSGIDNLLVLRRGFAGDVGFGDNRLPVEGLWADASFFSVFSYSLAQGNPTTALKEPYSIVLTEKAAKKLFGDADALGKSVKFKDANYSRDGEYMVTGVIKDNQEPSHLRFEVLVSFSTREIQEANNKNFMDWGNMWMYYVYMTLDPGTNPSQVQRVLDEICKRENASDKNFSISLALQPMSQFVLGKDISNTAGPTMFLGVVWVVSGLAIIVILSACFNYTNLSIARSLRRSREVGIRKVMGALKSNVLMQFITESMVISLLALVFSIGIFLVLRPQFLSMAPELAGMVSLNLSWKVIGAFLTFAFIVGMIAGFLPAIFFSRINPIQVLKDASRMRVFQNLSVRKALIIVQYTISLMFIATTLIGFKQYKNFISFDLGFDTANIVNIELQGNPPDLLKKELTEIPEVQGVSKSIMVTSLGNYWGAHVKHKSADDSAAVWYSGIDENYFPIHGHKFLAGRNFTPKTDQSTESEVIVNEALLKRFNITEPVQAIGEVLHVDGKELVIIGVLKDFHYGKVDREIEPVFFRFNPKEAGYLNVKILSQDLPATMAKIDMAWRKIDGGVHSLRASFYDDQIQNSYSEFSAMLKVIGYLAFLAICISSMGLLGMVVFITETRLKEVGIRKAMGASEYGLIYLLSRGFLALLAVSILISMPATYLFFDRVVLPNFPYHTPIGVSELLVPVLVVMGIALLMIGSQTIRSARTSPSSILRSE